MYYKVTNKNSEAFIAIHQFMESIPALRKKNINSLNEFTGMKVKKIVSYTSVFNISGSVDGIISKGQPSPDWIADTKSGIKDAWRPNYRTARGKEIQSFMRSLPCISLWDMHKVFKYKTESLTHPGIKRIPENKGFLVEFSDEQRKVKPLPGMVEIKTSEFFKLQGK